MNDIARLKTQLIDSLQTLYDMEAIAPLMEFCQGEMRVLLYLDAHPLQTVYPSQLSDALVVTRQRITTILSALRRKALIHMEIEQQDRRRMSVQLTREGQLYIAQKRLAADQYMERILLQLGEQNSRDLLRLLRLCSDAVKASEV